MECGHRIFWCSTVEDYYDVHSCTIVSTGQQIPNATEPTERNQPVEQRLSTTLCVTRDALAVEQLMWVFGKAYDTLDCPAT